MTQLVLLTGFLGAGKTTMMQRLLTSYSGKKVGVIINEFGEVNVDARLIKKDGIEMAELSNGSIFCACIKDKFVDGLIEMSCRNLDYLFIEASGLADPANMTNILDGISHKLLNPYEYKGSICIVDGESFAGLYELLPAITAQIEFCSAVVINKSDLIDEQQLKEIMDITEELNPMAVSYVTTYCQVNVAEIVEEMQQNHADARDSSNRPESRPPVFILKGLDTIPYDKLTAFLEALAPHAYRIKGFADTDCGMKEISIVGTNMHISDWDNPDEATEIVVISAEGFKMMSIITGNIAEYVKGFIRI